MQKNIKEKVNISLFEDFMKQNNMSLNQFCKLCGISQNTYYSFKKGRNSRLTTIVKIAYATKIKINDMLFLNEK